MPACIARRPTAATSSRSRDFSSRPPLQLVACACIWALGDIKRCICGFRAHRTHLIAHFLLISCKTINVVHYDDLESKQSRCGRMPWPAALALAYLHVHTNPDRPTQMQGAGGTRNPNNPRDGAGRTPAQVFTGPVDLPCIVGPCIQKPNCARLFPKS